MAHQNQINWKNPEERLIFEKELKRSREEKKKRSVCEKIQWFIAVFIVQLWLVVSLYGPCAYFIVSIATEKKKNEELILLQQCKNNIKGSQSNTSLEENCDATQLEYYDLQNYILVNLYPYLTCVCQGTAFLLVCLWHVTDYRWWNLLGAGTASLCLPVDILIFYIEPLGFVGTTTAMVLGFVPFCIIIADAAFPIKTMDVVANGKRTKINRNSWTKDISISYNQRYNFVSRITWKGWTAFSTLSLCIPLFKGSTFIENALGAVILSLEGIPQMMSLALGMMHWDSSFDQYGFELFESLVDIPLVLCYLSFHCSPETKNAVIHKLLLNCISKFISRYEEYVEKYIYVEGCDEHVEGYGEVSQHENTCLNAPNEISVSPDKRCVMKYDSSKFTKVFFHHFIYIILCPFIGIWESFNAVKDAFIRDCK